jgi:hypothetical protein
MPTIDMTPVTLDLTLYAGDGFSMRIAFIDKTTGDPWPIDGTWLAQVRSTAASTEVIADFVIDDSDADNGNIVVSLTGDDTRACLAGAPTCFWDLQQTPPGGQPRTWYAGKVKVSQDVTR